MPWIPAPSKIPSQRALIGMSGSARGDGLAREVAGPGAVGDVPGRVDRLVLHVVEPGRCLQTDLADATR